MRSELKKIKYLKEGPRQKDQSSSNKKNNEKNPEPTRVNLTNSYPGWPRRKKSGKNHKTQKPII